MKNSNDDDDPCNQEARLREERKQLNSNINIKHANCEESKYQTIYKYFNEERKSTFKDLLNALMHFYKDNKQKDQHFILTFQEFIDMFEKDTMRIKNFKKQHVFEALCKILLMYDYDEGELGRNKQFYSSLEKFVKNPNNPSNIKEREDIVNEDINVSSEGGVVDIFFRTETKNDDAKCEWMCDCRDTQNTSNKQTSNQEYILIQNKYYSKEKSDIKNYDVTKIYAKAQTLYESKQNVLPKIVLMVNNSQALSDKLTRSRDASKGLIDKIYGVYEIDKWFNLLLYDLYNSANVEDFLSKRGTKSKLKPELTPRFHQIYFTEATLAYYKKEGYKKFIWGAVPRSGKSYMIGNMISKRRTSKNDVVVILGAKTETESQFIKMFCDFSDYSEYGIIKTSAGKMDNIKNCDNFNNIKERNIYIFSQEWFKQGKIESALNSTLKRKLGNKKNVADNTAFFNETVLEKYSQLLRDGNKIDLYFDEIHKGGSTDNSENILNAFNNAGVIIDIFMMVTATFAKPNIKYSTNFIDTKEPKILEWSYEDQQIMKNIKNETKMDMMINSRTGLEKEIMRNIFEQFNFIYGTEFLDVLSKQYENHPELVLIQPYNKIKDVDFDIKDIFNSNIKCTACYKKQTIQELRNPNNIFNDYGRIQALFDILAKITTHAGRNILHPNCVYGYLKEIGAPDYSQRHSELWFLPDDDLYINPDECREVCSATVKKDDTHDEDVKDGRTGLPNIEPLTRGLAFALMSNPFFRDNYNVLIVHNTKLEFTDKNNNTKITNEKIFENTNIGTTVDSKNLSETIKEFETETYKNNKNLIILTGAKLRLGISLPCVDIGFNFDNIKSIDVNYQTMFRVLTERYNKPKKYGFYVDFNKGRFINFLYDYNNTYSSAKNISSVEENVTHLQGLILLFNINGFGLNKLNERQELQFYNILTNELNLNKDGYTKYYSEFNNMSKLVKKSLISVDIDDLSKLKSLIDRNDKQSKQKKIKVVVKEGQSYRPPVYIIESDTNTNSGDSKKTTSSSMMLDSEDTITNIEIIEIVSAMLPRIVSLLALFSNKNNYNCENLNECLENAIRKLNEGDNICLCENANDTDILACYFNSPFYNKRLLHILETIKELLNKNDYIQLRDTTNFIFNNIREMGKENKALIYSMTPEDIQKKIEQYLPVRQEKKDKHGEVFTPIELIEEMLDKLPSSVWKDPELKWLDPANGIGNFPMVVYKKLLEKLPDSYDGENGNYSTENGKKKHIIENMLYMVEIDPANVRISRRIFGTNANISCADFLEQQEKWKKDFHGVDKFDIIVGNPPFQDSIEEKKTDAPRKGGKNKLYERVTIKCFSLLNKHGYLLFVTPDNIMTGNTNKAYEELIKYNILHINLNNIQKRYFPSIGQSMCYFLIHVGTKKDDLETTIQNNNNQNINIIVRNRPLNPITEWTDKTEKIVRNFISDERNNAVYNRGTKESDYTGGKYKVIYTPEKILHTNNMSLSPGLGIKKIVLFESKPMSDGFLDKNGEYGVGPHTFYIPFETASDGKLLEKFFKSDTYKTLVKVSITSQYLKTSLISYLNINKILGNKSKREFIIEDSSSSSELVKREAAKKIKKFVTKKHRQRKIKNKTKSSTKGGKGKTKKLYKKSKTKKNRRFFFM